MFKKKFLGVLFIVFVSAFLSAGISFDATEGVAYGSSETNVSGILWENTTWTLENSPYIITDTVQIPEGVVLTIEPDVTVTSSMGSNKYMFTLHGRIIAHGTPDNKIIFDGGGVATTVQSQLQYGSAFFSTAGTESVPSLSLDYCIIRNGGNFFWGTRGHFSLTRSALIELGMGYWGYGYSQIYNSGQDIHIEYNTFINTNGFSIDHTDANIYIRYNIFKGNRGFIVHDHVDGGLSQVVIKYNSFIDMSETVLRIYSWGDQATMDATENYWGTTNTSLIDSMILDGNDDINIRGFIEYSPILTEPHPDTPTMPLTVNFRYSPAALYAYGTVTFNATASSGPYSSIANYTWDFGDGNIITTLSPIVKHAYVTSDSYSVTLTVTDEFGFQNSTATSLTVLQDDAPPTTVDDYDGGLRNADFTITLTATDHKSGVTETYYRINHGEVKAVYTDGQPRITVEGANNTLEYWSIDNAGNEELPHKILTGIKLDKKIIIFDAGIWERNQYNVYVISNSTISDFSFNPEDAIIQFSVIGETGTTGFCNVTIPKDLLDSENSWIVLVDGHSVTPTVNEDTSDSYIYFTYSHSTKTVEMIGTTAIPEFPSCFILPLIMIVALAVIVLKKTMLRGLNEK